MPRLEDLKRFYKLMKWLEKNTGGKRKLEDCNPLNEGAILVRRWKLSR